MLDLDKLNKVQWINQEYARCGKKRCRKCQPGGPGHGPYWRGYWETGIVMRSVHIGRELPEELRRRLADRLPSTIRELHHNDLEGQMPIEQLTVPEPTEDKSSLADLLADLGLHADTTREKARKRIFNLLACKGRSEAEKADIKAKWEQVSRLLDAAATD